MRPKRPNLRPERPDLRPERSNLRPERPDLRPKRPNLRSERPDLRPNGRGRMDKLTDERTNEQTNKQTNESPPVFYRTLSPSGPLPCFLSLKFTIMQSRAKGIADHILPLGEWLFFAIVSFFPIPFFIASL